VAKKSSDMFFDIFAGQYVIIVLNKDTENTVASVEMTEVNKTPMIAVGYLLEQDETYLYLGHSADEVHQAIKKEFIVHVEIHNEEIEEPKSDSDKLKELLKNPKRDASFN
jgi:hypothetical protein